MRWRGTRTPKVGGGAGCKMQRRNLASDNEERMRNRLSFAFALLLMDASAVGQDQPRAKQPSMNVATVALTIGMPRAKVLGLIQQAGYKYLELSNEGKQSTVAVTQRNLDDAVQRAMVKIDNDGQLVFRDGTLVRIQKEIAADAIHTDRDLAFTLYAVAQEFEKEGNNHSCALQTTVDTPSLETPGLEGKNLLIGCDAGAGAYRTIVVRWVTMETQQNQLHVGVFEQLGHQ